MSHKIHQHTRLLLPIFIFILLFIMMLTSLVTTQYNKSMSLIKLQDSVILATKISQLVHETQKERGYSSAYATKGDAKFKTLLLKQRDLTNKKLHELKSYLADSKIQNIQIFFKDPLKDLGHLVSFRKSIDSVTVDTLQIIEYYSDINDELLNIIVEISKMSTLPRITQNIISYNNFLYAKENAGIERALGSVIIEQNQFKGEQRVKFSNIISAQNIYIKTFKQYASQEDKDFYKTVLNTPIVTNVGKLRDQILNKQENFNINTGFWFEQITSKINELKKIDTYLEKQILFNIKNEIDASNRYVVSYIFFNILGVVLFVILMLLIKKLIRSETRLRDISDKYIISSVTDLKGNITKVSDAFCEISQYSREELIGKPHNIVRHTDMPKSTFKALWRDLKAGKKWQGEIKNLKKDGSFYWVFANIEPLKNSSGKIEGYTAIRLDITDKIGLESELQESLKKDKLLQHQAKLAQMGEMINMIAHQWRQPLTAISATASDLILKLALDKYEEQYFDNKLKKVVEFSHHLSNTIDDFRNFYKEDKEMKTTSYTTLVTNSFEIVKASLVSHKITLTTSFESEKEFLTYPSELQQVILNIIKNAEDVLIENAVNDAEILINSYDVKDKSILEIRDNAGGIPEDILEKIFEPYFSTKLQKDGTGLGLYMSKTIIEDHCNGILSVENEERGACFRIEL